MGAENTIHAQTDRRPRMRTRPAVLHQPLDIPQTQREFLPRVDFNMFTPNHLVGRDDLLEKFYSSPGRELVRKFSQGGITLFDPEIQGLKPKADAYFFSKMAEEFRLPETSDPAEFYRTAMRAANQAIDSFNQTVFPHETRTIGSLNAITAFDESPSTILYYLTSPDVDARLRFEAERQLNLARIAGAIESRARNSGFASELAKMQQLFDLKLFTLPIGSGENVTSYSWHDNDTNSVIELTTDRRGKIVYDRSDPNNPRPFPVESVHLKKHSQHLRRVEGVGRVFADLNSKDIGSAVNKAVRKAYKDKQAGGEGIIDIDTAVHDAIRAKMVVEGTEHIDDPKIDALIQRVTDVIEQNSGTGSDTVLGELESITRDDEKNGNNLVRFKRIQIKFKHVSTPIEIIFYDQKSNLEEELQVGHRDTITGHYNGYAHSLYEIGRLTELVPTYCPVEFYPPPNGNPQYLQDAAIQREEQIAERLRNARRVRPLAWEAVVYSNRLHN